MNWLPIAIAALALSFHGWWIFVLPGLIFMLHPLADLRTEGKLDFNPVLPDFNLILFSSAQIALVFVASWISSHAGLKTWEWCGLVLNIGISGGIGFTAAHELIHRRARWQRGLGVLLLATSNYAHYRVEHVFGHHKRVATPEDPATGRRGEGLYWFWCRSITMSYISAWKIELRRGKSLLHNRMAHYLLLQFAFNLAAWQMGALGFFLTQSFIAILLLEAISYVEHYGLVRGKNAAGEYKACTAEHVWDSGHGLTNQMLFNVGRHAHHHLNPGLEYQNLQMTIGARRLPAGYSAMLILALVPPLWRRVMDSRI